MQNFMSDGSNIFVSLGVKESRKTSGPGCSKAGPALTQVLKLTEVLIVLL